MDILRILLVVFLVLLGLTAEVSGLVGVVALIDLLIVPELFPNPGKVMGISVAMFIIGNILFIGITLSLLEWISEYGEKRGRGLI